MPAKHFYRSRELAFFTNHLGRWLNSYAFKKVAKVKYGFGTPNKAVEQEAFGFIQEQLPCVNKQLIENRYFLGEQISIADYAAFAYFENTDMVELSLSNFPAVASWFTELKINDPIKRTQHKLGKDSF